MGSGGAAGGGAPGRREGHARWAARVPPSGARSAGEAGALPCGWRGPRQAGQARQAGRQARRGPAPALVAVLAGVEAVGGAGEAKDADLQCVGGAPAWGRQARGVCSHGSRGGRRVAAVWVVSFAACLLLCATTTLATCACPHPHTPRGPAGGCTRRPPPRAHLGRKRGVDARHHALGFQHHLQAHHLPHSADPLVRARSAHPVGLQGVGDAHARAAPWQRSGPGAARARAARLTPPGTTPRQPLPQPRQRAVRSAPSRCPLPAPP